MLLCLSRSKYKAQSYRERTEQIGVYSQWSSCPNNAAGETKVGSVDKKVHGIRLSRQCQIKKKKQEEASRWKSTTGFFLFSFSLSFFLSLSSQSARQCGTRTHTHSRTHSVIHTSPKHTHSLWFSSYRHYRFSLSPPLSLCLSAPPFPFSIFSFFFLLFAFAVCFALQPPPLSLYRSFAPSLPLHSFSPSLHFPPPPPLFSVCAEWERPLSEPHWARTMEWWSVQEIQPLQSVKRERAQVADWLATALNKGPAEQIYGLHACKTKMRNHLS